MPRSKPDLFKVLWNPNRDDMRTLCIQYVFFLLIYVPHGVIVRDPLIYLSRSRRVVWIVATKMFLSEILFWLYLVLATSEVGEDEVLP